MKTLATTWVVRPTSLSTNKSVTRLSHRELVPDWKSWLTLALGKGEGQVDNQKQMRKGEATQLGLR